MYIDIYRYFYILILLYIDIHIYWYSCIVYAYILYSYILYSYIIYSYMLYSNILYSCIYILVYTDILYILIIFFIYLHVISIHRLLEWWAFSAQCGLPLPCTVFFLIIIFFNLFFIFWCLFLWISHVPALVFPELGENRRSYLNESVKIESPICVIRIPFLQGVREKRGKKKKDVLESNLFCWCWGLMTIAKDKWIIKAVALPDLKIHYIAGRLIKYVSIIKSYFMTIWG